MKSKLRKKQSKLQQLVVNQNFIEAVRVGQEILIEEPDNIQALKLTATSAVSVSNFPLAEQLLRTICNLNLADVNIWQLLGVTLTELQQFDESQQLLESLFNQTGEIGVLRDISRNLAYMGDIQGALSVAAKLIELRGNEKDKYEFALLNIFANDIGFGWVGYRNRKLVEADKYYADDKFARPWDGRSKGHLLILFEQGIGDQLLFASLLEEVARVTDNCTCVVDPRLIKLLSFNFPAFEFINNKEFENLMNAAETAFDFQCYAGDLFEHFRPTVESFNVECQQLRVPTNIKSNFSEGSEKVRIGFSWKGGNNDYGVNHRTIPVSDFSSLVAQCEADWACLQHGDIDEEVKSLTKLSGKSIKVDPLASPAGDFMNYAALISGLDVVVTVDNAVANLAGVLGVRTILLTSCYPYWWWRQSQQNKSLFLPSVKVISKESPQQSWRNILDKALVNLLDLHE